MPSPPPTRRASYSIRPGQTAQIYPHGCADLPSQLRGGGVRFIAAGTSDGWGGTWIGRWLQDVLAPSLGRCGREQEKEQQGGATASVRAGDLTGVFAARVGAVLLDGIPRGELTHDCPLLDPLPQVRSCTRCQADPPPKGRGHLVCAPRSRPPVKPWGVATNAENIRARDTKVIAAAWRLIAREGVLALTVQALADEASVPMSSMRYTMPSQAVVRERALEAIGPSIRDRISALPVDLEGGAKRARLLLHSLLPLDAERRLEASVLLTLSASVLTEPGLQPIWREVDGTTRDVCAQALRALGVRGDVVSLDHLHTLMVGLTAQLMNRGEARSPQWALTALDRELVRFSG